MYISTAYKLVSHLYRSVKSRLFLFVETRVKKYPNSWNLTRLLNWSQIFPLFVFQGNGKILLQNLLMYHCLKVNFVVYVVNLAVDAHNVIPAWAVSNKQEWAARTIRSKIHSLLPRYLTDFVPLEPNQFSVPLEKVDWEDIFAKLKETADVSVPEITWAQPGVRIFF